MNKIAFYIATIGWTMSLLVHLLSLAGRDVIGMFPFLWLLHVGIFIVLIPAIFVLNQNKELKAYRASGLVSGLNPLGLFKIIFRQTPKWLRAIAIVGLAYAWVNFMFFMGSQHGSPDIRDGQYILHNHGTLIRTLTEQEYHLYQANMSRGFSGHWIAFYGLAAALLYPFSKREEV